MYKESLVVKTIIKNMSIVLSVFVITVLFTLLPYIKANYLTSNNATRVELGSKVVSRSIGDFVIFSSRPWYLIIPPDKNPFLGNISKRLQQSFTNTNYYLADDYFAGEHSANYYGIILTSTVIVGWFYLLKKASIKTKGKIIVLALSTLTLLFIMFPPYFTFQGITIYTPGYLLYKFFPMFRVTARFGIVVYFFMLTLFATIVNYIYLKDTKTISKLKVLLFVTLISLVTFLETFVPVKIVSMNDSPRIYTYFHEATFPQSTFVVYPYSKTKDALLWLSVHQRGLVNPHSYLKGDYDSEIITRELISSEGLRSANVLADFLVVYKDIPKNELDFFLKNLNLIDEFDDYYLFYLPK